MIFSTNGMLKIVGENNIYKYIYISPPRSNPNTGFWVLRNSLSRPILLTSLYTQYTYINMINSECTQTCLLPDTPGKTNLIGFQSQLPLHPETTASYTLRYAQGSRGEKGPAPRIKKIRPLYLIPLIQVLIG